ncbi:glycosyltransferase [Metabacillus sp. Hm71]|uniref:glycosyltransferase n=1 Tax=Metabacillus sp. Hm71 TaxID=3450743 RepID=UPI003F42E223
MKKYSILIALLILSFSVFLPAFEVEANENSNRQNLTVSQNAIQLKEDLRKFWIDHTIWTRAYTVSAVAGLDDQEEVLERLLKNQSDIGNAIKPFYGEEAGNKLTELLREHILIAGKIIDAAKSGNQTNVAKFNKEWFKNADDITDFLSKANPNWDKALLKDMLHTHLKLVTDDLVARLDKNWTGSIKAFDEGLNHMIKFSDVLTEGIIKQFPNKF